MSSAIQIKLNIYINTNYKGLPCKEVDDHLGEERGGGGVGGGTQS